MPKNIKKLTILHSNDMHGDFLPKYSGERRIGGAAMLSGYIDKVRGEEENVLYVISGDTFRGSLIDSEYKGVSTIEILNMLAPDCMTLGNHEVDYGVAHMLFVEKCSNFPIINANLYITTNNVRLFRSHVILNVGGMRILIIGVLTDEVLTLTRQDRLIGSFINSGEAAAEIGKICTQYRGVDIDLTIILTHIGFDEDKKLAEKLDPAWGVDCIIGGHSHSLMDKPCVVSGIPIVQAGCGTAQLGRFDMYVNTDTDDIDSYEWRCVPLEGYPENEKLSALISR
ncbi:MAG: metallophosphatase, partial [Eubacteriales bacterium]